MSRMLSDALVLAVEAHRGQVDKANMPYILHPLRVMLVMIGNDCTVEAAAAAVLHDAIEDTPATFETIEESISHEVATLVEIVTRRDGEEYDDYIDRCRADRTARKIKLADLADNLSPARKTSCPPRLRARYETAWEYLR